MAQPYELAKILWAAKKFDVDPEKIEYVSITCEKQLEGDTFGEFTTVYIEVAVAEKIDRKRSPQNTHYVRYDAYDFDTIVKEIIEAGEGLT